LWEDSLRSLRTRIRTAVKPEPILTVSEWADEFRILDSKSSVEPGPWRTSRTPYLREIMDSLSPSDPTESVVFMKGTQLGATEVGNNWLGYVIHRCPAPMLYVQPTLEQAEAYSKQRIAPMIEACEVLRERVRPSRTKDSSNTVRLKEFDGGLVRMVGANSPASLSMMPIRFAFFDEEDRYPISAGAEGDPVEIGLKRTATYKRNRKIFHAASPTIKGGSRIEAGYEASDKRIYLVPCPFCDHRQQITWASLRWDKNADETEHYPETVRMICAECGREIQEHHKTRMLARGGWVPTAKGDGRTRGYHLSALYSPLGWYSWEDGVRDFLRAKRLGREALQVWTNTCLAETFEERGERAPKDLFSRRERFEHEAPEGVLVITAGVDVQADRLEIEVVGWGEAEESWSLDYRVIRSPTDRPQAWERLDEVLEKTYEHASGERFRVNAVGVDASYSDDVVYRYVRDREIRNVWALKGVGGGGRPLLSAAKPRRRGRSRRPVHLVLVGVDEAKAILYSRLRLKEPGPGYTHFPIDEAHGEEYFAQLTAERRQMRYQKGFPKPEWVLPPGQRNEALDCRVYAMAALYLLDPVFDVIARKLEARRRQRELQKEGQAAETQGPKRRSSGWMTGWRRRR
jgi:phage terminase large subunit GpA-like protein